jgi:hypothetical protein
MTTTGWWSISPPGAVFRPCGDRRKMGPWCPKRWERGKDHHIFWGEWADLCGVYQLLGEELDYTDYT